mmetsp:Transcript_54606/g.127694  ORF Transcript_54606/g.127694 Transcript_54606/m.127694 type:complete len:592 (+) Transcript_54606:47-1822(+)
MANTEESKLRECEPFIAKLGSEECTENDASLYNGMKLSKHTQAKHGNGFYSNAVAESCRSFAAEANKAERLLKSTDLEWNASLPTWAQSVTGLPMMKEARKYYRYLLPAALIMNVICVFVPVVFAHFVFQRMMRVIHTSTCNTITIFLSLRFLTAPVVYVYHYYRLRRSTQLPQPIALNGRVLPKPLLHAVVVVAYKEPMEVLDRTFASIANQQGLGRKPIAVFAAESRDETRHKSSLEIEEAYGDKFERLLVTEHSLVENESAGKSSNENFALRELRRVLDADGIDPFEVMITIVDADSILSSTYLAHVEDHFYRMPDGRRVIFNGPLNTYRNFAEAGLLVQFCEMKRCHVNTFYFPFEPIYPLSNYSLTLGFASEIDYWTPDNMPEDIHTSTKAALLKFSAYTTVPVPAVICNDLVPSVMDRYTQAKRHQWGITEITYIMGAIATMKGVPCKVWLTLWGAEAARSGSFFEVCTFSAALLKIYGLYFLLRNLHLLTWQIKVILMSLLLPAVSRWVLFWLAEISLWRSPVMHQFPIQRIGACNWLLLIILSPILELISEILFSILPTIHCLYHVTFVGELAYITAPKGAQH